MIHLIAAQEDYFIFGKWDIKIPEALFYALMGILVVFVCLLFIILLLTLLEKVFKFNLIDRSTAAVKRFFKKLFHIKSKTEAVADVAEAAENVTEKTDVTEEEEVAAVMAAISCVMNEGGTPAPFRIRSIRRTH